MSYCVVDRVRVSESQVSRIWRYQLLGGTKMVTEDGKPIRIVYPGRLNDDRGADFRDVVIATDKGLVSGEVEIHVKSSSWQAHRHHQDPAYNQVILHVVLWRDTEPATTLENGERVPILALSRYLGSLANPSMPCLKAVDSLAWNIAAEFLDAAGKKRFLAKAKRFQVELARTEAGQLLYLGIMGALGYSKNKIACLELARRLPLYVLESVAQGKLSDEECLAWQQALLLGTAGLLPSQRGHKYQENIRDDEWVGRLEQLWAGCHHPEVMSESDWHQFKVRPNNVPVLRIAAMSYLVLRYRRRGIFEEMLRMVRQAPTRGGYRRLEAGLLVYGSGYWAGHFDFGSGTGTASLTLLGSRRAADIIVNVLLPFAYAWGKLTSQPELTRKAVDLYCSYPRLTENAVERHMKSQFRLGNSLVNSAQRQQGLIHIYDTLCTKGRCNYCPLGQVETTDISKAEPQNVSEAQPSFSS